jgi:uncharacterized protein YjiK
MIPMISSYSGEIEVINYTPDGVFALEKNNRTALFFLEIDRGTEVLSNPEKGFSKAINFY